MKSPTVNGFKGQDLKTSQETVVKKASHGRCFFMASATSAMLCKLGVDCFHGIRLMIKRFTHSYRHVVRLSVVLVLRLAVLQD